MVHSVAQLTTIISVVHTCVYLPNGEQALVTHVGTMQVSSTLTLTDVLCVHSFTFNLISISKLTKNICCCLIFLCDCCFIQDVAKWSTIGLGKAHNGLFLLKIQIVDLMHLLLLLPLVLSFLQTYGTVD